MQTNSYDFSVLLPFIERLRNGVDLVMGNRFKGGIAPGAMRLPEEVMNDPCGTRCPQLPTVL